jgi:uncharacterized protein YndB with AHSA1/START domain
LKGDIVEDRVELRVTIDSSPEDIYRAFTKDEQLSQWFAEYADVSQEDSRFGFWGKLTPETPAKEEGGHRLLGVGEGEQKFEWEFRGTPTTVLIEFLEEGPRTQLNLTHIGLPTRQQGQFAVSDFWSMSLENLRAWVERNEVGLRYALKGRMDEWWY